MKPARQANYEGAVREDKVLILLVEFEDFKHNNIIKEEGYMYSNDFSKEHYENMLFGDKPFQLLDGKKFLPLSSSMKSSPVEAIQ